MLLGAQADTARNRIYVDFLGFSEFMHCSFCFQEQNRAARGLALWVRADLFKTVNNTFVIMPFVKTQQPKVLLLTMQSRDRPRFSD